MRAASKRGWRAPAGGKGRDGQSVRRSEREPRAARTSQSKSPACTNGTANFHVLRDINLKVARGERIVICGPSGGGKSTLLRCINRLEDWQRGRIVVDGIELTDDPKHIVAVRRDVGMVFQQFNLFPHLTVLENCTLAPIWVRHMPKQRSRGAGDELSRPA